MSTAQPPKLATFLMERLAGCEPVLLGDLQEEYGQDNHVCGIGAKPCPSWHGLLLARSGAIQSSSCARLPR